MKDTRKRSVQGGMKTALVCLVFGVSWGTLYGCSSDAAAPDEPLGTGGGSGTGGGGNASCGKQVNDPNQYQACSSCTGGRCVPKNLVTVPGVSGLLTACDANNVCVPDNIVAQGENIQLTKCTSISGAEGRCASTCIGAVAALEAYLPSTGCGASEKCVPCFNPATGQPTGLCGLGCDPQPASQPVTWGKCCGSDGLCAPKSALPQALADQLGAATCKTDEVCVPAKPIESPGSKFPCCTITLAGNPPPPPIQGACAPACVMDAGPAGASLPQGSCATAAEKCVPCADGSGNPTGACSDAAGKPSATCQ